MTLLTAFRRSGIARRGGGRRLRGRLASGARRLRDDSQTREEVAVGLGLGIPRRQELVTVEDGIRAREETQRLHRVAELAASGGQPNHARPAS